MDLKQAEIGLLIALDALLETGGVTAAARRLNVSQPAMSAQLARLRRLFNDPLLIPSGRRLLPTTKAQSLKEPLHQLLSDLDALVRESADFDPKTSDRSFRLIGTDYVHAVIGPSLAQRLSQAAPQTRLALLPFDPPKVWSHLEEDSVDAALAIGMDLPEARVREGLEEDFLVIRRKAHPRGQGALDLEAFCAADHLLISPEGGGFTGATDRILERLGRSRRVVWSLPSFLLAPAFVATSDVLCLLPRRLALLHQDKVDCFELPFPSPRFTLKLFWHPRRQADPAHVWFRAEVLATLKAV